jgi:hypothetical protein
MAPVSHEGMINRVSKLSLTIVPLTAVVAGIIALKLRSGSRTLATNAIALLAGSRQCFKPQ